MAKYLIHACEKRMWYVDNFLIPSLLAQGIEKKNITLYVDISKQGSLLSFIKSVEMLPNVEDGTWHIQDDVVISSKFKEITEAFDKGIVCGFCSYFSEDMPVGLRPVDKMWYSFPCIRIPNAVAKNFVEWVKSSQIQKQYQVYIGQRKFEDYLFYIYVKEKYRDKLVHNLCPNIVDHVDYLIGGSTGIKRDKPPVSLYFDEKDLIEELKCSIENSVYKHN